MFWFTVLEGTFRMGEKAWLQKKVAAGHIASAIRKLRTVKPGVQIIFYSTRYPRQGVVLPTFKMSLLTSANIMEITPHRYSKRLTPSMTLDPVKLTIPTINTIN